MTFREIIDYFGNENRTALGMNLRRATVNVWKFKGVPLLRQYQIERLTRGEMVADDEDFPAHLYRRDQ